MQQPLTNKQPKATSPPSPPTNTIASTGEYYGLQDTANLSASLALNLRQTAGRAQFWLKQTAGNSALLQRTSTHFIVILVIITAIGLRHINFLRTDISVIRPLKRAVVTSPDTPTSAGESSSFTLPTRLNNFIDGIFSRAAVPRTVTLPDPEINRLEDAVISTYVVEPGDTIFGIAAKLGLAPETILWSNNELEDNPDLLQVGQELLVLPVDGVYHQVGAGDTIEGIAATFKADPAAIINHPLNNLNPDELIIQAGQWLIVPEGAKPFVPRTVTAYTGPLPEDATAGTGAFGWPTSGAIYQGYWSAHPGIDIAAWEGAVITTADSGYVVAAGWDNTGYGYSVVVDHGNGFQTLYAHLQAYYVDAGENVVKGQEIGEMGTSGNATGPHLHFEVRQGTIQRNPNGFLP